MDLGLGRGAVSEGLGGVVIAPGLPRRGGHPATRNTALVISAVIGSLAPIARPIFAHAIADVGRQQSRGECIMLAHLVSTLRRDDGQDLIEYGLLGAFISVVTVVALQAIGPLVNDLYVTIQNAITP